MTISHSTGADAAAGERRLSFGSPDAAPGRLILGDNLAVLRSLPESSIDLIYIDPPFFSGRDHRLINGDEGFADNWRDGLDEYLSWLRERFTEMHRVLRRTGVLCVHCDWHAGHYIKVELDTVFGVERFRNEIVWHYGLGAASAQRHVLRKHDTIFVYAMSDESTFNRLRGDVTDAMLAKYCHEDERGRYMMSHGRRYYLKGGKPLDSVWNIPAIAATSRERVGYPTQKPLALLERILRIWSHRGDVVADFFAGSGTTAVAAQSLGRSFIACDDSAAAITLAAARLEASGGGLEEGGMRVPDVLISTHAEK